MPEYQISVKVTGYTTVYVEAENEDVARALCLEDVDTTELVSITTEIDDVEELDEVEEEDV